MTTGMKLKQFLLHEKRAGVDLPYDLIELIHEVSITCNNQVNQLTALASCLVAGMGSEEVEDPIQVPAKERGEYLLMFDPLDGSSNIDVNISVGTIFSVLKAPMGCKAEPKVEDFYQKGTEQKAAGFVVYGPATVLVLTTGQGVNMFTLDNSIWDGSTTKKVCTTMPSVSSC